MQGLIVKRQCGDRWMDEGFYLTTARQCVFMQQTRVNPHGNSTGPSSRVFFSSMICGHSSAEASDACGDHRVWPCAWLLLTDQVIDFMNSSDLTWSYSAQLVVFPKSSSSLQSNGSYKTMILKMTVSHWVPVVLVWGLYEYIHTLLSVD